MNHEHDVGDANSADKAVSDWVDDTVSTNTPVVSVDKRRVADLLWIHSLLELSLRDAPAERTGRIDRVMATIRGEPIVPADSLSKFIRQPRWITQRTIAWLTAAVLLVCAGVWMQSSNPQRQVHAAVDQICQSAAMLEDREYRVTLTHANSSNPNPDDAHRTIKATLFVRGGESFVVKAPALLRAGDVWFGRDREGAWFQPAVGPVLAGSGALVMQQNLLRNSQDPAPFLQITTILDKLADNYDVRLVPIEAPLPPSVSQHVQGTLRPAAGHPVWLPDLVDIQASSTGTVHRLLLNWSHETPSGLQQIHFDFVRQSRKPDNWYRPGSHIE